MAEELELEEHERQVLSAISAIEAGSGTATVAALARETGLSTDVVEDATSRLTDLKLVRERRVELDDDAVGAGREFTVRAST